MEGNPYIKQYPELFKGKKVMYVHGFGSSGQSGTVTRIREVLPNAEVTAPDLPIRPQEAIDLLHDVCDDIATLAAGKAFAMVLTCSLIEMQRRMVVIVPGTSCLV